MLCENVKGTSDMNECNGCKHLEEKQFDKMMFEYHCKKLNKHLGKDYYDYDYEENPIIVTNIEQIKDDCYEDEK